jgi:hypothetical protein
VIIDEGGPTRIDTGASDRVVSAAGADLAADGAASTTVTLI